MYIQRRGVTRVAWGARFPGRQITIGEPKRPNNVISYLSNTLHLLPKDLRFEHESPNLLFTPRAIQPRYATNWMVLDFIVTFALTLLLHFLDLIFPTGLAKFVGPIVCRPELRIWDKWILLGLTGSDVCNFKYPFFCLVENFTRKISLKTWEYWWDYCIECTNLFASLPLVLKITWNTRYTHRIFYCCVIFMFPFDWPSLSLWNVLVEYRRIFRHTLLLEVKFRIGKLLFAHKWYCFFYNII